MRKILIAEAGTDPAKRAYGLPWEHTATCFNFRGPRELVTVDEIRDIPDFEDIETVVISVDLEDYSFISKMSNLRYLYIYRGNNITNLEFLKGCYNLFHLYVGASKIESLASLVDFIVAQKEWRDKNDDKPTIHFTDRLTAIAVNSDYEPDYSYLLDLNMYFSELIINGDFVNDNHGRRNRRRRGED